MVCSKTRLATIARHDLKFMLDHSSMSKTTPDVPRERPLAPRIVHPPRLNRRAEARLTTWHRYTGPMDTATIVEALDAEIQRLQRAKELLSGTTASKVVAAGGRRTVSVETRARMAAAQQARRGREKPAAD